MIEGGLGPSFAPPINQTADLSMVAGATELWPLQLLSLHLQVANFGYQLQEGHVQVVQHCGGVGGQGRYISVVSAMVVGVFQYSMRWLHCRIYTKFDMNV